LIALSDVCLSRKFRPKNKNPTGPVVLAVGFPYDCPAYDLIPRSSASRRQKTHTDSRSYKYKSAWSSGRRDSYETVTVLEVMMIVKLSFVVCGAATLGCPGQSVLLVGGLGRAVAPDNSLKGSSGQPRVAVPQKIKGGLISNPPRRFEIV
jgi:hypothetical protein